MSTVEQIELDIDVAKAAVAKGEALRRLSANEDFKTVIREGYFEKEAVRLTRLKAAPAMASEDKQKAIVKSIDAIGELYQYLGAIEMTATQASRAIDDAEMELSDMAEQGEV